MQSHADRRVNAAFDLKLRAYPDGSMGAGRGLAEHHATMRGIAHEVDGACGGLLHLELAENKVRVWSEYVAYWTPV